MAEEKTETQKLYEKASQNGKVSNRNWLQLGKKKEGGGVEPTGPHQVKLINDRVVKGRDYHTQEEEMQVEWIFEENGVEKKYRQPVYGEDGNLHYLVERLYEFNYGDELILEMKRSGNKNIIDVRPVDNQEKSNQTAQQGNEVTEAPKQQKTVVNKKGNEIPVIEENPQENKGLKEDSQENIDTDQIPF